MSTPPGIRAEQALLGTFLSEPGQHLHLLSVVSPADMFVPYHGQVLAAIQRLDSQGALAMLHRGNGSGDNPVPAAVLAELGRDPDMPAHIARDGNQLHTLMAAAPVPPNPESYAAIVVNGSLRREITILGKRVAQAARHYELPMLESALELAGQAAQDLEKSRARWEALPAAMRQSLRVPPSRAGGPAEIGRRFQDISIALAGFRDNLWASDLELLAAQLAKIAADLADTAAEAVTRRERAARLDGTRIARPEGEAAKLAGARALSDLAAAPAQIGHVGTWLQAGHFADAGLGELYQIMGDLTARGMPCDPVIVAWEAARRGLPMEPRAIEAALRGGSPATAISNAQQAHRHAVRAGIARAGAGIVAAAGNPANAVPQIFSAARAHLGAVGREHQALLASRSPARTPARIRPHRAAAPARRPATREAAVR